MTGLLLSLLLGVIPGQDQAISKGFPVEPVLPSTARELMQRVTTCDAQEVGISSVYDLDGNPNTFELVTWSSDRVSVWVYWDRNRKPDGTAERGSVFLLYPDKPPEALTIERLKERFPGGFCEVWRRVPR